MKSRGLWLSGLVSDLALAFDCENGLLWKFWQAGQGELPVKLQGAVYNGEHGPQPVSQGKVFFTDETPQLICSIPEAKIQYLGNLRSPDGTFTLRWQFEIEGSPSLPAISVTPKIDNGVVSLSYNLDSAVPGGAKLSLRPPGTDSDPLPLSTQAVSITLNH